MRSVTAPDWALELARVTMLVGDGLGEGLRDGDEEGDGAGVPCGVALA